MAVSAVRRRIEQTQSAKAALAVLGDMSILALYAPLRHWSAARTGAINAKGDFGTWCWDVAFEPVQGHDIIRRHGATNDAPVGAALS